MAQCSPRAQSGWVRALHCLHSGMMGGDHRWAVHPQPAEMKVLVSTSWWLAIAQLINDGTPAPSQPQQARMPPAGPAAGRAPPLMRTAHPAAKDVGYGDVAKIWPGAESVNAAIAQLGERQTEDLKVACSIHARGVTFFCARFCLARTC